LKAASVKFIKRNVLAKTTPDVIIEIDGSSYKILTITKIKSIKNTFVVDQSFDADFGFDFIKNYLPSLTAPSTLLLRNNQNKNDTIEYSIDGDSLQIKYSYDGVVATRTFRRA
jgi:hypothetical protein